MSKTKKQIILFMIIVLIGIGYTVNEYIIAPNKLLNKQKEIQLQADKQKLIILKSKRAESIKLKAEVEKLKQATKTIGDVTVTDIDTPQLIFDFYSSCLEYGIKGENLVFQLADSNTKVETPTSANTSNSGSAIANNTNGTSSTNSTVSNGTTANTVNPTPPTATITTNKTDDINKLKATTDLLTLTIELRVSGDKNQVEKYIRSLNSLTARKINVKSIKLSATVDQVVDNNTANNQGIAISPTTPNVPNTTVLPEAATPSEPLTDKVTADIIFNQYVYSDGKNVIRPSNYSFYDENTGFSHFSDMFK